MAQISVITPVFNVERYLKSCLDSLVNQTMEDVEFICVDDGSTDSSGVILDEYAAKDRRINVIHKQNTGYGHTMNVGLDAASGDYVAIVESDDFADINMLKTMYGVAVDSNADIVKADHYDYKNGVDKKVEWLKNFPQYQVFRTIEYPAILEKSNTIWSCLYKRSFLVDNNIRFHETPGASYQDVSFAMQTWLKAKRIYFIEEAFLHYRNDNPDSSMHNTSKIFNTFDEFEWLENMFEDYWNQSDDNKELEKYYIQAKIHDFFSNYNRIAGQFQYAFLLRFHEEAKRDFKKGRIHKAAFAEIEYEKLMQVIENYNAFFKKTAKIQEDLRFKLCDFKNEDIYFEGFLSFLKKHDNVVLYGAGKVGQRTAEFLKENNVEHISFLVSNKESDEVMGIPVIDTKELDSLNKNTVVLLSVAENLQYELYSNLTKVGCKFDVLRIDKNIMQYVYKKRTVG